MVRHISDEVAVMYKGEIVEQGKSDVVYGNPAHPYTQLLISSMPTPKKKAKRLIVKDREDSKKKKGKGCSFYADCPKCTDQCRDAVPELTEIEKGHLVSCFNTRC